MEKKELLDEIKKLKDNGVSAGDIVNAIVELFFKVKCFTKDGVNDNSSSEKHTRREAMNIVKTAFSHGVDYIDVSDYLRECDIEMLFRYIPKSDESGNIMCGRDMYITNTFDSLDIIDEIDTEPVNDDGKNK